MRTNHTTPSFVSSLQETAYSAIAAQIQKDGAKYLQGAWELLQQGEPVSMGGTPAKPGDPARIEVQAVKFHRGDTGRDTDHFGKGIGIILNVGGSNKVE